MAQLGTLSLLSLLLVACSSSTTPPVDGGSDSAADSAADSAIDGATDSAAPDTGATECPGGESYFEPGCGEGTPAHLVIEAGCHQPCEGPSDDVCNDDAVCQRTTINPCICRPEDEVCCGACGSEEWLCLPPPPACEGRDYCDCGAECEPLVDLSTGCICNCDSPFNCTMETCDCVCGGATYLGCAPAGQCDESEINCGACETVMVDGCPTCEPGCEP